MINKIDWPSCFSEFGPEDMTEILSNNLYSIISSNIPNKVVTCNDMDPPWLTLKLKKSIKESNKFIESLYNVAGGKRIGKS